MTKVPITTTVDLVKYFYIVFLVQGVLSVLMTLLVLLYPPIITVLVAAAFLWFGIVAFVIAWRVRRFSRELSDTTFPK